MAHPPVVETDCGMAIYGLKGSLSTQLIFGRDQPMIDVSETALNNQATDRGAARVTLEALEANIKYENYFTAYDGAVAARGTGEAAGVARVPEELRLISYCVLTLQNGFSVTGQSACADPNNYNADIGWKLARNDAVRQIWPLMGYELRSRLATMKAITDEDMSEALTRLLALELGNPEALRPRDAEIILKHVQIEENV